MTGYGDAMKAFSLIDFKHLTNSTGVVKVLNQKIYKFNFSQKNFINLPPHISLNYQQFHLP